MCFVYIGSLSRSDEAFTAGGLLLIVTPLIGIIASAFIIARGANKFSIGVYVFFTLLFALGAIGFILAIILDGVRRDPSSAVFAILVCLLHTGLFGWLTYSMWKNRRRPENVADTFDAKNHFQATVIIVITFFGAIFLLSGLLTGLHAWFAADGQKNSFTDALWGDALFIGSFVFLPSGLMVWAGLRQMRRGNNKFSGIIFFIAGAGLGLYGLRSLIQSILFITSVPLGYFGSRPVVFSFIALALAVPVILCGYWLLRVSIRILRNKPYPLINPKVFE